MLDGRKQPRTPERFVLHISAVYHPRLADIAFVENVSPRGARVSTEHFWEPGSYVYVKSRAMTARARVVYCLPGNCNTFAAGLSFLLTTSEGIGDRQVLQQGPN